MNDRKVYDDGHKRTRGDHEASFEISVGLIRCYLITNHVGYPKGIMWS